MNTIFAQCSAPGKAGVAVFRISGPSALKTLQLIIKDDVSKMQARKMYFQKIYNPKNNEPVDEAMIVLFQGSASFTGEDSVEIHTHGSIAVLKMMHEMLSSLPDVRIAEPGEFARRSFLNGKIDLTAAEGLADLIDAETYLQHKQAIRQLGGGLADIYESWRKKLLAAISLVEAYIDFPDEDIPQEMTSEINELVEDLSSTIRIHLDDNNRGERLRQGIKLAIIGKPNAGKSSLLNFLMQRNVAIVSDISGTTRDVIEGHLDIDGYPIIIQDTAGIRDNTSDAIEKEGMQRAKDVADSADIKIIMHDVTDKSQNTEEFSRFIDDNSIILLNKIDKISVDIDDNKFTKDNASLILKVSIKNEINTDEILKAIKAIAEKIARPSESPQITRARHRGQLQLALSYMEEFSLNNDLVLAAEDLRMTMRAISNITGAITVDDILGEIFSNFCIGK